MMKGQTAQIKQTPEFLKGRVLTLRNAFSHQHQNLSTNRLENNNLAMVEHTPRNQNSC